MKASTAKAQPLHQKNTNGLKKARGNHPPVGDPDPHTRTHTQRQRRTQSSPEAVVFPAGAGAQISKHAMCPDSDRPSRRGRAHCFGKTTPRPRRAPRAAATPPSHRPRGQKKGSPHGRAHAAARADRSCDPLPVAGERRRRYDSYRYGSEPSILVTVAGAAKPGDQISMS
ncbi:hypothetical protein U9M48_014838 [Paspalum notatum var. saurae]|uniref:Uncharacterized protein n=1 Tax=Paspalum notatum var. saurae TaxID=547442 RepID=A0AAQ3WL46_PASNO